MIFQKKSIFIDCDNEPDITHGEAVTRFIEEGVPNAKIEKVDVGDDANPKLIKELENVLANINKGEKYDAVNVSLSLALNFKAFSNLNLDINKDNISKYKKCIMALLNNADSDDKKVKYRLDTLKLLDKIGSKGVKIYCAAGNEKNKELNLYSLVENAKTVGGLDSKGNKWDYSADNSLVSGWEQGVFKIKKMVDSKGKCGYDYTGDGTIDFYQKEEDFCGNDSFPGGLCGTSFATPKALSINLMKENDK